MSTKEVAAGTAKTGASVQHENLKTSALTQQTCQLQSTSHPGPQDSHAAVLADNGPLLAQYLEDIRSAFGQINYEHLLLLISPKAIIESDARREAAGELRHIMELLDALQIDLSAGVTAGLSHAHGRVAALITAVESASVFKLITGNEGARDGAMAIEGGAQIQHHMLDLLRGIESYLDLCMSLGISAMKPAHN